MNIDAIRALRRKAPPLQHWLTSACLTWAAVPWSASAQILPPGATATQLTTGYNFTEGPLDDGTGGILFTNLVFGNLNGSDIIRYDIATGQAQTLVNNSGGANGLARNATGDVVSMDGATRQVSIRAPGNLNQILDTLADEFNGAPFNSPNDLVIDSTGGIYFTDPDYNNNSSQPESVYYIDAAGELSRILTGFANAARPNGIALSPDEQTLYLALEGQERVLFYDVVAPGVVDNETEFARTDVDGDGMPLPGITNGPDGLTIDSLGNLYAAVQNAVFAWNPEGQRLFDLPVQQNPTNVGFGPNGQTLYITAGNSLYGVELNLPSAESADFDEDGDVDGADLLAWQRGFGILAGAAPADGDANGDGAVDGEDLAVWDTQFNSTGAAASAAQVPEPAAAALAAIGGLVCLVFRLRTAPPRDEQTKHGQRG